MRIARLMIAAAFLSTPLAASAVPKPLANVAAMVASSERDADNVKLDESRKPAQLLSFFGLRKGMNVIDMFGGNRYWSEIIAPAVGPTGKVVIFEPTQFYKGETPAKLAAFVASHPNVSVAVSPFEAPKLPRNFADFVLINLDYHDVYWQNEKYGIPKMDPAAFLRALHGSVKHGGIVGIVDHAANAGGDTRAVVDKLHRIDPEVVKRDFRRAGFVLVGSSSMLRNPDDDHSLLVFDPKIRGKTDRFVLKFKKP